MKATEYKQLRNKIGTIVKSLKLHYYGFSESRNFGVTLYEDHYINPSRKEANELADKILEKLEIKPEKKVHQVK